MTRLLYQDKQPGGENFIHFWENLTLIFCLVQWYIAHLSFYSTKIICLKNMTLYQNRRDNLGSFIKDVINQGEGAGHLSKFNFTI